MTPRLMLLFSLCGVLLGMVIPPDFEDVSLTTVDECCQDGTNRGDAGHDCTNLPGFSSTHMCRIAQEQCCSAAREKHLCLDGVIMALGQGACEIPFFEGEPWEAKHSKICCDCCTLGLMKARDSSSCDFPLLLNVQCSDTAKACCLNKTEDTWDAVSLMVEPEPEANVTDESPVYCTDVPCEHFCINNNTCGCLNGFQLHSNGFSCKDIDECQAGTHNCFGDLACVNTEGSFLCQKAAGCSPGYKLTLDNNCQDVNECVAQPSPCLPGETCLNTEGSFMCRRNTVTCGRGYYLSEDATYCHDVDECATGSVCGDHGCINLVGTYRCECKKGFFLNSVGKFCQDLNECRYYQGLCAHHCENTEGSYRCTCAAGFRLSADGINCEDVDECADSPCSHDCNNVYGSYWCYCPRGYQLSDADGTTCEDVDECAAASGGYPCSYSCSNIPGSYYCTCPPTGYILGPNGQTCLDIDECSVGTHTCSASQSCYNIQGGFRCLSFTCPPNFHEVERGHCNRDTCKHTPDPAACLSLPLRISFYNISFPVDAPVPTDVFRMGPSNSVPGDQVSLAIASGDEEGYFGVESQGQGGGIFLRRALSKPRDFSLTVVLRLTRHGNTHLYMARIALFVTNDLSHIP